MNSSVSHIRAIDEQLAAINKIIASNEHVAAGIKLAITIGDNKDCLPDVVLRLGLASDVDGLIKKARACLLTSREFWMNIAQRECCELQAFLRSVHGNALAHERAQAAGEEPS